MAAFPAPARSGFIQPNVERCRACAICVLACSLHHEGACSPQLARLSAERDLLTEEPRLATCLQCDWPSCYFACPAEAIVIDEKTGARVILEDNCTGCGLCAKACPLNPRGEIIRFNPATGRFLKCDLCQGRVEGPACVEACPWGALVYVTAERR